MRKMLGAGTPQELRNRFGIASNLAIGAFGFT
jgi:hypothetical protein